MTCFRTLGAVSLISLWTLTARAESPADRIATGLMPPVAVSGAPDIRWSLEARMKAYRVPGVSVAFFEKGKPAWTITRGLAEISPSRPITPETLFQAASISKVVSATAALKLVEQGALTLDDDVNQRLSTWQIPETAVTASEKVTLRRLLSHSAGLTVHGFNGYAAGALRPTLLQILDGQPPANNDFIRVDIEPGSEVRYSGGGYVVLQLLLGDVTHQAVPALLQELVLAPAGMSHSAFEQPLSKTKATRAAAGYDQGGAPVKGKWHTYPELTAAGLWTTPTDLARLANALSVSWRGESDGLLMPDTAREMLTTVQDEQGLGPRVSGEGPTLHFWHSGANAGYRAMIVAYPQRNQVLAVMTNSDNGMELIAELLRAVAREYGWSDYLPKVKSVAALPPGQIQSCAGSYEARDLRLTFEARPGSLILKSLTGGTEFVELLPSAPYTFFDREGMMTATFQREGGAVVSVVVDQGGSRLELPRVGQ